MCRGSMTVPGLTIAQHKKQACVPHIIHESPEGMGTTENGDEQELNALRRRAGWEGGLNIGRDTSCDTDHVEV